MVGATFDMMQGDRMSASVVERQLYRAWLAIPAQREWAETASQCVSFLEGDQWDENERLDRQFRKRPCLTINKIKPLFNLVLGYMGNRRSQPIAKPGNDALASDSVAETLTRLLSSINAKQGLKYVQTDCFIDGLSSGRGYIDCRLDFTENALGEVKLRSPNPFMVFPDPEADSYDPRDWNFVIESRWYSLNEILTYYGGISAEKANAIAFDYGNNRRTLDDQWFYNSRMSPASYFGLMALQGQERAGFFDRLFPTGPGSGVGSEWFVDPQRKVIKVLDCQHKMLVPCQQFVDVTTGRSTTVPDDWDEPKIRAVLAYNAQKAIEEGRQASVTVRRGMRTRYRWTVTAGDVLLHDDWSPYDRPTLMPFFPYFRRGRTQGMIHDLLDPQREINKRRSNVAEIVAKTAAGGWMYEEGSLKKEEERNLARYGSTPGVIVKYKQGREAPEQIQSPMPNNSQMALETLATSDLKEISGINDSALGQVDTVQSGRAVLARQQQAVVAVEPYFDNFARTTQLLGEMQIHCIQLGYTEERIFRARGENGLDVVYKLNRRLADGAIENDVTRGSYEAAVDLAPHTGSFEDLEFQVLMEMQEAGLPIMQVAPDIVLEASPVRRKQELIDRIRLSMGMMPGQPTAAGIPLPPTAAPGAPAPAAPGGAPPGPPSPLGGGQPTGLMAPPPSGGAVT
jgi:hypothetical protein